MLKEKEKEKENSGFRRMAPVGEKAPEKAPEETSKPASQFGGFRRTEMPAPGGSRPLFINKNLDKNDTKTLNSKPLLNVP